MATDDREAARKVAEEILGITGYSRADPEVPALLDRILAVWAKRVREEGIRDAWAEAKDEFSAQVSESLAALKAAESEADSLRAQLSEAQADRDAARGRITELEALIENWREAFDRQALARPEAPTPAEPRPTAPPEKRTCNRHSDCAAAEAARPGKITDHCHDECCEDCFGC